MTRLARRWILVASVLGALGVALGAFGAHGVPSYLETRGFDPTMVEKRLDEFNTAARYQMYGALLLFGLALAMDRQPARAFFVAAWLALLGVLVFSSVIYTVALVPDDMRGLFGRFAPVGGSMMIAAWVAAAVGALQLPRRE